MFKLLTRLVIAVESIAQSLADMQAEQKRMMALSEKAMTKGEEMTVKMLSGFAHLLPGGRKNGE